MVKECQAMYVFILFDQIKHYFKNKNKQIGWYWWRVPFCNLKYFVVNPPFMMHDSWLFSRGFTHLMNILPNPYLFKAKIKNWWLTESKAFWMSIVINMPFNFSISVVCKTSAIKRPNISERRLFLVARWRTT